MPDFLFDGPNKLVIEPPGSGDTQFDVARDLYSAWKRWVASGVGAAYLPAFAVEGGTPIGATGLFTGGTIILVNGWKVQPADHQHQLTLVGNLFSDDGVVNVPAPAEQATVFVSATVGAQGIASGSGLDAVQDATLTSILKVLANRIETDPVTGKMTVYDDDNTTPLLEADLFEDVAGSQAYRDQGYNRRDRLEAP